MQQPPRGETWVGSTCKKSKFNMMQVLPGEWLHISISRCSYLNVTKSGLWIHSAVYYYNYGYKE
ncbi:hypothetical protein V1478_005302 [Vespula squamosa]|uniref:Uncharacterized protein n=1 Tax=Vespula squamosa TaxID=30214 RepID=A0ABD2BDY0_VESSQ